MGVWHRLLSIEGERPRRCRYPGHYRYGDILIWDGVRRRVSDEDLPPGKIVLRIETPEAMAAFVTRGDAR